MAIPADDPHPRKQASVLGTTISYAEVGEGRPIVFLHGNPTSSYLWRNVIPHVEPHGRCLAPDLVGMGRSGPSKSGTYRFTDHFAHVDAWLEAVRATEDVVFVVHDWGSAIGFHWSRLHADQVAGIAYMEAIVKTITWDDWPESARRFFQGLRSDAGEEMVLERNLFVERVLPASIQRDLSEEEMDHYRAPYPTPESRHPILTWPREIPIDGDPADVHEIVTAFSEWLPTSEVPKLFIDADPGSILTGDLREFARTFANQAEVTVPGIHFIQEDAPHEIGGAIAGFAADLD